MGTAPDVTATFDYTAAATSAAAIKALLGTAAGKNFRVDPEHVLAKCASGTSIVVGNVAGSDDILLDIFSVEWLLGRIIDITALKDMKAIWMFRKAFLSQVAMDLQQEGGLRATTAKNEGELVANIMKAARAMPKIKAVRADVLELASPATNTWIDEVLTSHLISEDGSARSYMQFRAVFGRCSAHGSGSAAAQPATLP